MSASDWVRFAVWSLGLTVATVRLSWLWNLPLEYLPSPPKLGWWQYAPVWRAFLRTTPSLIVLGWFADAVAPLSVAPHTGVWGYVYWVCIACSMVIILVVLAVALFNRPSFVVPPALRHGTAN